MPASDCVLSNMGRFAWLLIALLTACAAVAADLTPPAGAAVEPQLSAGVSDPPAIVLRPSPPLPSEVRRELLDWQQRYASGLAPVASSWRELLDSFRRFHLSSLEERCAKLEEELSRFDPSGLLPAPEPVLGFHLADLLDHLRGAARICSRRHYFETGQRLEEAAVSFSRLQGILARRLGAPASHSAPFQPQSGEPARSSPEVGDPLRRAQE